MCPPMEEQSDVLLYLRHAELAEPSSAQRETEGAAAHPELPLQPRHLHPQETWFTVLQHCNVWELALL